jgi:glycosyltransferase involved in cell wall biosynthesis
LIRILPLLLRQSAKYQSEIVVIDDGSEDDTIVIVEELMQNSVISQINLIKRRSQGRDISKCRNIGIKYSLGKILLFLDSDIVPGNRLISRHMAFHDQFNEIRSACMGRIVNLRNDNFVNWRTSHNKRNKEGWLPIWVGVAFANISLKKTFLTRNELYFSTRLNYLEDLDMAFRSWEKGLRVFYSPETTGYHCHSRNLNEFIERGELEAKALRNWEEAVPCVKQMLSKSPLKKKFYFVSPSPNIKDALKNILRRMFITDKTEKIWIYLCEVLYKHCFHLAYKIASQIFIRRFIKTYKK